MTRRPRILFLINSLCGGGAERVMSTILTESEDRSDQFEIFLGLLDQEAIAYPIPDWVTVHQLDCRFRLARSLRQAADLFHRLRPDATISFLTRANVANCLVARASRGPAIISERINTDVQLGSGVRGLVTRTVVRNAYPRASRVIAVAHGIADTLIRSYGVDGSRIEVIPNPVDVEAIRRRAEQDIQAPAGPFVFAMGRLTDKKNYALLLEAFARSGIPGRLVIAGEGPERPRLQELASRLGIAERVSLPGFLPNPHALLARAHAFVLSSNAEGFPNALVEALSLGVPSIATNCADGPAEILAGVERNKIPGTHESGAGIIVPVNDPDAMSEALKAIQEPALRERLSAGGSERAAEYSVRGSVDRYWDVIQQALERFRAAAAAA